jgi:hypothetical protein
MFKYKIREGYKINFYEFKKLIKIIISDFEPVYISIKNCLLSFTISFFKFDN